MILVDTSVWIDYFNNIDTKPTVELDKLIGREPILVGDLILCEILQGARSDKDAAALEGQLRNFEIAPLLDGNLAIRAAANYRLLRGKGVTVRKTIDLIIGTFCIERRHILLHADRDFEPMQRHLGLQTL
jgi:predicted nucleic acid-binding protein